jgi:YVTN family beta-propeller protein
VIKTLTVGERPRTVAVNPQTRMVYVTNEGTSSPGSVSVIDGRTNTVVATIPVSSPFGVAASGQRVYVTGLRDVERAIRQRHHDQPAMGLIGRR